MINYFIRAGKNFPDYFPDWNWPVPVPVCQKKYYWKCPVPEPVSQLWQKIVICVTSAKRTTLLSLQLKTKSRGAIMLSATNMLFAHVAHNIFSKIEIKLYNIFLTFIVKYYNFYMVYTEFYNFFLFSLSSLKLSRCFLH